LKLTSKSPEDNILQQVKDGEDLPPLEIMFEAFVLELNSRQNQSKQPLKIKIIPKFIKSGDQHQYTYVKFVAVMARRGKIKIGAKEIEIVLAHDPYITSHFDNPMTGLYLEDDIWKLETYLCTMRNVNGKLYSFSATPDGSQLMVRPYEGEYGFLEVGKTAGNLNEAKFTAGSLLDGQRIICLEDCPREDGKIKIPVGNYQPLILIMKSEKLDICFNTRVFTLITDWEEKNKVDMQNILIADDTPFAFDFTHETQVEFSRPQVNEEFKPGEEVSVASMINIPEMDLKLMGLHDPTAKFISGTAFGLGERTMTASIHPVVKITNSNGTVMHEGIMPFG